MCSKSNKPTHRLGDRCQPRIRSSLNLAALLSLRTHQCQVTIHTFTQPCCTPVTQDAPVPSHHSHIQPCCTPVTQDAPVPSHHSHIHSTLLHSCHSGRTSVKSPFTHSTLLHSCHSGRTSAKSPFTHSTLLHSCHSGRTSAKSPFTHSTLLHSCHTGRTSAKSPFTIRSSLNLAALLSHRTHQCQVTIHYQVVPQPCCTPVTQDAPVSSHHSLSGRPSTLLHSCYSGRTSAKSPFTHSHVQQWLSSTG